ncbi:hypothetical protein [uncultured Jatrophihabitans sp.]|uniref:hypothetical protein n=1 Tax=uncultured Jatrophihabitans sp. TaxID=1610747 RepID=UPI0035CA4D1C
MERVATAVLQPGTMDGTPVLALTSLFDRTTLPPSDGGLDEKNKLDIDVIRDAELDAQRVRPYGGAIAVGRPVGASGSVSLVQVARDLVRRVLEHGVARICIGFSKALAAQFRDAD